MHEAAGAPLQLTNGACAAAQSTGAVALRGILQARSLALQLHRERAVVDRSTDMCAADHHVGRALREDNHGPRMLVQTRTRRASCRPGGGRPSSSPERPCPRGSHVGSFGQTFTTSDPAPHSGSQLPSLAATSKTRTAAVIVLSRAWSVESGAGGTG